MLSNITKSKLESDEEDINEKVFKITLTLSFLKWYIFNQINYQS